MNTDMLEDLDTYIDFNAVEMESNLLSIPQTMESSIYHKLFSSIRDGQGSLLEYPLATIPSTTQGYQDIRFDTISRMGKQDARFEYLALLILSFSNKLSLDSDETYGITGQMALELFQTQSSQDVLERILSTHSSTAAAFGERLLSHAVSAGDETLVGLLLKHGIDPNSGSSVTESLFTTAVSSGHPNVALQLIQSGADANLCFASTHLSGLMLAVSRGYLDLAAGLLVKGEKPGTQNLNGVTALHIAAKRGDVDAMKLLVHHGGAFMVKMFHDRKSNFIHYATPFEVAARNGRQEMVQYMASCTPKILRTNVVLLGYALPALVAGNHFQAVEWLLSKGVFAARTQARVCLSSDWAFACDRLESHPLEEAAWSNNISMVKLLLQNHALLGSKNHAYALEGAAYHGNLEMVEIILKGIIEIQNLHHKDLPFGIGGMSSFSWSMFEAAIHSGSTEVLEMLLSNTASAEYFATKALPCAVMARRMDMVKVILLYGADINAGEAPNENALTAALSIPDNAKLVEFLLNSGADPKVSYPGWYSTLGSMRIDDDYFKSSPLVGAIENYDDNIIERLLREGARNGDSETLAYAVTRSDEKLLQKLLAYSQRVSSDGCAALIEAISSHEKLAMLMLLDSGVDINKSLPSKSTKGNLDVTWTASCPISVAVGSADIESVKLLLGRGAAVNGLPLVFPDTSFKNYFECPTTSALSYLKARDDKSVEVARLIITAGAELDAYHGGDRNEPVLTPLQMVVTKEDIKLAHCLITAGADVNAPAHDFRGRTALQAAASVSALQIVDLLLDNGADVNASPALYGGATALQFAAAEGSIMMVLKLIRAGADINAPGAKANGWTALESAAINGRLDIVRLLLDRGADIKGRDNMQYRRAVGIAWTQGQRALATYLQMFKKVKCGVSDCQPLDEILESTDVKDWGENCDADEVTAWHTFLQTNKRLYGTVWGEEQHGDVIEYNWPRIAPYQWWEVQGLLD